MSRIATPLSFLVIQVPGGKKQVTVPGIGKFIAENDSDIYRIGSEGIDKMTERLGRPPTINEALYGPMPRDDRDMNFKMRRETFKPRKVESHPMQKLADSLREGEGVSDEYRGLSLKQRLALDCEKAVERDSVNAAASEVASEKMKRIEPELKRIDEQIQNEKWRTANGSQKVVDLCEMLRINLTEGGDPATSKILRAEIKEFLDARDSEERTRKQAIIESMNREIARLKGGSAFSEESEESETQESDSIVGSQWTLTPEQSRAAQMEAHRERAAAAEAAKQAEANKAMRPVSPIRG